MRQETIDEVLKFRDDRNWKQFHNPKDLAISISLEAAELLEVFQWLSLIHIWAGLLFCFLQTARIVTVSS